MKVESTDSPEIGRVVLPSSLTKDNRQDFKRAVMDDLETARRSIVVDATDCRYVDSTGLGVLVTLSKKVREQGREFVLANLSDDLQMLFELTKLDTLFFISDTVDYAMARLAEPEILPTSPDTTPRNRKAYNPTDILDFEEAREWWGCAARTLERMDLNWSRPVRGGRLRCIMFKDLVAHYEKRKAG